MPYLHGVGKENMTTVNRFAKLAAKLSAAVLAAGMLFTAASPVTAAAATTSSYSSTSNYGSGVSSYTSSEVSYLAALIYLEAGNQSYAGKVAVGSVVVNRMNSSLFPDDFYSVLLQQGQFYSSLAPLQRALNNGYVTSDCYSAAYAALAGEKPVGNALFYCTTAVRTNGTILGDHCFYGYY